MQGSVQDFPGCVGSHARHNMYAEPHEHCDGGRCIGALNSPFGLRGGSRTACALCMHDVRYFEQLLQEIVDLRSPCKYCPLVEVAGGRVRAPLGEFTCKQCNNRLKDDKQIIAH